MGTTERPTPQQRDDAPRHAVVLANWVAERAERDSSASALARQRAAARLRARAMHPSARGSGAEVIPFPRQVG